MISSGSLFTRDYLEEAITSETVWNDAELSEIGARIGQVFAKFPTDRSPNEAQTESDLIWPILEALGWQVSLTQQNLTAKGRDDVPDGLLFLDDAAKTSADRHIEDWKRYEHGVAVVEAKRWRRPLDRRSGKKDETNAPSTQMLRYLRRVEDLTRGKLRWGILTNGETWRLYYQGARSVSEQFLEIDLAALFRVRGELFDADESAEAEAERQHWLKVFLLMFRREAFAHSPSDSRTFHQRALEEGKFYEERVAKNLSNMVFNRVFPTLAKSIAAQAPTESLDTVRNAALILLYRLLFLLFAEDRNLLPVRDRRYDDYSLREKVRGDIGRRKDTNDTFSTSAARYWSVIDDLSRAIDKGDISIGLPAYNGGLFNRDATPLLANVRLPDNVMADVIDLLSFEQIDGLRRYINYRDLSVQQLGSIYERLLEFELTRDPVEGLIVRPNLFARKNSGSYYTPDELVQLVLRETLEPLITERLEAFRNKVAELNGSDADEETKLQAARRLDPAEAILTLRVCDPAMGSGHFLVNLVDFLADTVIDAMAEATAVVQWEGVEYISPLADRIASIRSTIQANADANKWTVDKDQLDDRHIIRRMVLKRCVYGVDKNEMAVELAKVSLWLHTFTVGAPLSFLDHHLRCGDSLFGESVGRVLKRLNRSGQELLINEPLTRARASAASMQTIEGLTDAEIAEAHRSAEIFEGVVSMTAPLDSFMKLFHAIDWLNLTDRDDKAAVQAWLDGQFGDPVEIARGRIKVVAPAPVQADLVPSGKPEQADMLAAARPPHREEVARFAAILARAQSLVREERFLNWEVSFPGVWRDWDAVRSGGFDAVIGNPPWDRIKLQEIEWFGLRDPRIAMAVRASDRVKMIKALEKAKAPIFDDFTKAKKRAEDMAEMARKVGDYPLLSGGDINLYSLFVERAMQLLAPTGMMGLLTPSGIASDKTASKFFRSVATTGRLKALYDFENRRTRYELQPFFPDVDSRFKFIGFIGSRGRTFAETKCAFFLQSTAEISDPDRCFPLSADDFARVNPNTGTAPILRTRRDAMLTKAIYNRVPVLVDRSGDEPVRSWPVKYVTMFHMTNDSGKFRTKDELKEREGAWHVGGNNWQSATGPWVPLYVGRMIHQFDHRAASVEVNEDNIHNPALSGDVTTDQKVDPSCLPVPQYWVSDANLTMPFEVTWMLAFRDIARATDARTIISSLVARVGLGNTLPCIGPILPEEPARTETVAYEVYLREVSERVREFKLLSPLLVANMNSIILDFIARQKVQSTHLNWYIVEQFPFITPETYTNHRFGPRAAAEVITRAVLELTYTSHDMAPFARDMGHVDADGNVLPPFTWNETRRLRLRAKLDAVYFHLYGIFDATNRAQSRDDIAYIYSTFPIVERQEMDEYGRYLSRDLALAYCNTLAAGHPDAEPEV